MAEEYKPWLWKVPENSVIGKRRVRRVDGFEKASGTAVFVRDIYRPGMLYGKLYLSPHAHAKIKKMDTSKAEALIGVRAVPGRWFIRLREAWERLDRADSDDGSIGKRRSQNKKTLNRLPKEPD